MQRSPGMTLGQPACQFMSPRPPLPLLVLLVLLVETGGPLSWPTSQAITRCSFCGPCGLDSCPFKNSMAILLLKGVKP